MEICADGEIVPDADYEFAGRIGKKYGADIRQMDAEGESRVYVVLHPVKINAQG